MEPWGTSMSCASSTAMFLNAKALQASQQPYTQQRSHTVHTLAGVETRMQALST